MKTAISVPDNVFRSAEQLADRLGVSRSELYSKAVTELIAKHKNDLITSRLNEIYSPEGEPSSLDEDVALLQHHSLRRNKRS